jgi:hypothetical protein
VQQNDGQIPPEISGGALLCATDIGRLCADTRDNFNTGDTGSLVTDALTRTIGRFVPVVFGGRV